MEKPLVYLDSSLAIYKHRRCAIPYFKQFLSKALCKMCYSFAILFSSSIAETNCLHPKRLLIHNLSVTQYRSQVGSYVLRVQIWIKVILNGHQLSLKTITGQRVNYDSALIYC